MHPKKTGRRSPPPLRHGPDRRGRRPLDGPSVERRSRIGVVETAGPARVERSACPRCTDAPLDRGAVRLPARAVPGRWPHHSPAGATCTASRSSAADDVARRPGGGGVRFRRGASVIEGLIRPAHRLRPDQELLQALDLPLPAARSRAESTPGTITLEDWQQESSTTIRAFPARADPLRWLPHDELGPAPRRRRTERYEYPRYFFTNKSLDILALCCTALDRLGIAHRRPRWDQVSVARREAVAALDVWVGPKT